MDEFAIGLLVFSTVFIFRAYSVLWVYTLHQLYVFVNVLPQYVLTTCSFVFECNLIIVTYLAQMPV